MSFEFFREINQFLPMLAFGWLMFRAVHAWSAEWAKPDHQWHYRALLCIVAGYVFLSDLGAIVHEHLHSTATIVSALYTVQSLLVVLLCAWWPNRKGSTRREPS